MERLSKQALSSGRAVFSTWSAPRPLLCNGVVNTPPNNREDVFSVRSVPSGYKKAVEIRDASLPGYELRNEN
jgi:hypothetical protein